MEFSFTEYLASRPRAVLDALYTTPWAAAAVLRGLPPLAQVST